MALLRREPVWAAAATLAAACGAGETGHVEVERAVAVHDAASADPLERIDGFMFSSRQSSRFEPGGLLLYFDLELAGEAGAQLEIDLPREPGREPVVRYIEESDGQPTFESDSAAGAVELAEDLDGRLCACSDGRFDLRLRDDGADGAAGTADDQVRELRNGIYRWDDRPCERDGERVPVALAELDRVEVRPVDHCMGRPQSAPTITSSRREDPQPAGYDHDHDHDYDPFYDRHAHHVIYVESYGCGAGPGERPAASSTGCGGSRTHDPDVESSGCEGDTRSSSASGCGDDSASDGWDDSSGSSGCGEGGSDGDASSSGCEGDDHDASSGCEQDTSSRSAMRAPQPCAHAAPPCSARRRPRPHLLAGPFQNYLWIAFAAAFSGARARRRRG